MERKAVAGHDLHCTVYLDGTGDCICDRLKAARAEASRVTADSLVMVAEKAHEADRLKIGEMAIEAMGNAYDSGWDYAIKAAREAVAAVIAKRLDHYDNDAQIYAVTVFMATDEALAAIDSLRTRGTTSN